MAPKSHTCHWHIIERSPGGKKKKKGGRVLVQMKGGAASSAHFSNELLNRLCHGPTEANKYLRHVFLVVTGKQTLYLILILKLEHEVLTTSWQSQERKYFLCVFFKASSWLKSRSTSAYIQHATVVFVFLLYLQLISPDPHCSCHR